MFFKLFNAHSCLLLLLTLSSQTSALPLQAGTLLSQNLDLHLSQNATILEDADLQSSIPHCFERAERQLLLDLDDCAEALHDWHLLAEEEPGLQSFSSRNSQLETDDEVPMGKIKRTCLALLGVDPDRQHEQDRFSLGHAFQALLMVYETCIKGSKALSTGGSMRIGHNKGFYVSLRSPKPYSSQDTLHDSTESLTGSDGSLDPNSTVTGAALLNGAEFGLKCFDHSAIPEINSPDCREALQYLRYAPQAETFSTHPRHGQLGVPHSWYSGSCEIRLGLLDPQARPRDLRIRPQVIAELAHSIITDCVTNKATKRGGITHLAVGPIRPSPWGVFVIRRGSLDGGLILTSRDQASNRSAAIADGPTDLQDVTSTTSRRDAVNSEALDAHYQPEDTPQANLSAPLNMIHPACFPKDESPVPITIRDCWPAIHSMMTADRGILWHHSVQWGGTGGLPVPRKFTSGMVTITISSIAHPPTLISDSFTLEEAGNNLRWLITNCHDFRGGHIGIGAKGVFFAEVKATRIQGPLAPDLNATSGVEDLIIPAIANGTTATS